MHLFLGMFTMVKTIPSIHLLVQLLITVVLEDAKPLIDQYVVYLGGGIDFGHGIGKKLSFGEVINESENNDEGMTGITVLGSASAVPNILKKHFNI